MNIVTLEDVIVSIEQLIEDSTDLQDFKDGFEEYVEEVEYSLEDNDGIGTGSKVSLGVGAAGVLGGAAYIDHKNLAKRKLLQETVKPSFIKKHGLKMAGAALGTVGAAAYGAHQFVTRDERASDRALHHFTKAQDHMDHAENVTNSLEKSQILGEAMKHTGAGMKEVENLREKGKVGNAYYRDAMKIHSAATQAYHTAMIDHYTNELSRFKKPQHVEKFKELIDHHTNLLNESEEKLQSFLSRVK